MIRSAIRAVAALALCATFAAVAPPPAAEAASSCGGGSGDTEPEGRPYQPGTEDFAPSERKHQAFTTINANGQTERCECTAGRIWWWGLDQSAIDSLKAAMDAKEALAIHNYAQFGVPEDQVPVEARTIWLRTAWRSSEEQVCLKRVFGSGAATPGTSKHEWGMAIDIEDWGPRFNGVDAGFVTAAGWCRTVPSEPWHYEYRPLLASWGQEGRCIK
ncbi:MAG: M15 family metallopeptidase [Microthrixaceae bacterium]